MEEVKIWTQEEKAKLEKPVIACPFPYRIENLEFGKEYLYCTCGLSKTQPFCDNSHIGTKFQPLKFVWNKQQSRALLCGCKRNDPKAGPFCDGSHTDLDW